MVKAWCVIKCTKITCFGVVAQQFVRTSQCKHLQEVISHSNEETLNCLMSKPSGKTTKTTGGYDETIDSPKPNHQRFEFRLQRLHDLRKEIPSILTFAVNVVQKKHWETFPNHEYQFEKRSTSIT